MRAVIYHIYDLERIYHVKKNAFVYLCENVISESNTFQVVVTNLMGKNNTIAHRVIAQRAKLFTLSRKYYNAGIVALRDCLWGKDSGDISDTCLADIMLYRFEFAAFLTKKGVDKEVASYYARHLELWKELRELKKIRDSQESKTDKATINIIINDIGGGEKLSFKEQVFNMFFKHAELHHSDYSEGKDHYDKKALPVIQEAIEKSKRQLK